MGSGTSASFYYYDDRGNQTLRDAPGTGSDRTIRYTADGKAHEIQLGNGQTTRFWYGPDGQRYKRTDGTTTNYYVGGVEVVVQNGVQTARRYVAGVALQTVVDGAVQATRYLFHDHLGSLVRIANVDGSVAESLDYTAFGDRRAYGNPSGAGAASTLTPRGFTGHEMVDGAQVIHMNGRIYDPQLGRFLQPDPVIQEPTNAQSWNAYTYVFNNPLAYTDPSGMMSERAWNNVWRAAALVVSIISMGATSWHMGISTQAGITAAAAGGFFAGYAATGTLKSAVIGAFSAAITAGIAGSTMNSYEQMAAQAVTGGVVESLQGGSFGHGFVAAGLTVNFMPQVGGYSAPVRTALGALIGGTISAVTGGKFANGAISGAVQGAMARKSTNAIEPDESAASGTSRGSSETADTHIIRQVELAPGITITPEDEVAINNINDALARYGRAVYASGDQEGIQDYNTATLLYDPQTVLNYSAKYGVNAAAYATINKNKITFGRTNFKYNARLRGLFGDQTSMTLLPMRMSSVYTAYITHEFGHLHSMYTIHGELGSANYLRYMRPHLQSTGTVMLPILPRL